MARSIYSKKIQKQCPHFTVFGVGICVQRSLACLGASPDAKVFDPAAANNHFYGILEIKCPMSKRTSKVDEAAIDPLFFLENLLTLITKTLHCNSFKPQTYM